MKKQDLLNYFDNTLLDKLFGFCYARTNDSHEAEELCSDIIFALVKASKSEGEIESVYPFIWKVARNVYADFSNNRRKHTEKVYEGDSEEFLLKLSDDDTADVTEELLHTVYKRIAFLTKAYREVMILFYIDGLSTAEIAKLQNTSEGAVRQRLFSAREKIKNEVKEMADTYNRPVALDKIDFVIWGTGNPGWGDPRNVCTRVFSKHIIWLCHKKPMSASEIAEELNVPTLYVEEELEILTKGANGEYGFLRRLENGKYALNFILLDADVFEKATSIYEERLPHICDIITKHIEERKAEYLSVPLLNKKTDLNLIYWMLIYLITNALILLVAEDMQENQFSNVTKQDRPFSMFGYIPNGKYYIHGCDEIEGHNICGFSDILFSNMYNKYIQRHFSCGHNISTDPLLQLALRAIDGLDISSLTEEEKEHSAKAVECGYLYRDGNILYTKILTIGSSSADPLIDVTRPLFDDGYFDEDIKIISEKAAALVRKFVPEHLIGEWRLVNALASQPVNDAVMDHLIEKGLLTPPENGIGAEGCFLSVEK